MPADIQFDPAGNMWVSSASQTNNLNSICVFNPSQVATGGLQAPHLRITSPMFTLVEGIRFDSRGDLWVSCNNSSRVLRFSAASVAVPAVASTDPRALDPVGFLESDANDTAAGRTVRKPGGIVFDNVGNMFINSERESAADASGVLHFSAQQVTGITNGQTVQARVLIARSTSNPGFGGLALERP
jgi:secreted PhoX family phosphatase